MIGWDSFLLSRLEILPALSPPGPADAPRCCSGLVMGRGLNFNINCDFHSWSDRLKSILQPLREFGRSSLFSQCSPFLFAHLCCDLTSNQTFTRCSPLAPNCLEDYGKPGFVWAFATGQIKVFQFAIDCVHNWKFQVFFSIVLRLLNWGFSLFSF